MPERFAIIVGSGFEDCFHGAPLTVEENRFGTPSAALQRAHIAGCDVLTLARHGEPHRFAPHAINYRANLLALQAAGADSIIALNTVGVISAACESGEIAVPDQVLDYTWGREHSIHDGSSGPVEHIDFTDPFSGHLRKALLQAARAAGVACHDGGVYAATQGPRLESAAEIDRLERDGADFVGMTAMPEAAIARELGLCYACIALVVNKAAGRGEKPIHDDVETHTKAVRQQTETLLRQFFKRQTDRQA